MAKVKNLYVEGGITTNGLTNKILFGHIASHGISVPCKYYSGSVGTYPYTNTTYWKAVTLNRTIPFDEFGINVSFAISSSSTTIKVGSGVVRKGEYTQISNINSILGATYEPTLYVYFDGTKLYFGVKYAQSGSSTSSCLIAPNGSAGLSYLTSNFISTPSFGSGISIGGAYTSEAGGIAIGNGVAATIGTNIGCSDISHSEYDYLNLGINGTRKAYMTISSSSWSYTSDKRDKTRIKDIDSEKALEFITNLSGKTYVYNLRDNYKNPDGSFNEKSYLKGTKKATRRQSGFLAQDVYQTMIDVFGDENYAQIVDYGRFNDPENGKDQYYMSQEALIPFLVESVKQLKKELDELKNNEDVI